jgi:hypothetical protein
MQNAAQSGELKPIAGWVLALLSVAVGLVAGFGAVVFRDLIGGFHNLLFLGRFSFDYDANLHTAASPWGAWVIFVPVLGYHDGKIRPVVAVIKSVASALSIGSGGSVGREGPIIQIGAAFGSTLGQLIAMPVRQSRHVMSPDFRVFSESESTNEALVRPALARGQVLVVMGPQNDVRDIIGPWCGSEALVPSANAFVTVGPDERIGEVSEPCTDPGRESRS